MNALRWGGFFLVVILASFRWGLAQDRVVIQGGTIVNVRDGSLIPNGTLVIEGDQVVSISRTPGQVPAGAAVIDARGKYLIPGLIDTHAHYKDWAPELYLNHGVTTVVSAGDYEEWIGAQKEGIQSGFFPGPRLLISSNLLQGPPENEATWFRRRHFQLAKDPEEALRAVRGNLERHVDAVKVYGRLSLAQLRVVVQEAQKANVPVFGHFENAQLVIDSGANGIMHAPGTVANTILDKQAQEQALKKVRKGFDPPAEAFLDFSRLPELITAMVKKGIFLNPTLRMSYQGDRALREKGFHYQDFDLLVNNWGLRYVSIRFKLADLKEFQELDLWHWSDLSPYEQDLFHQGFVNSLRLIKAYVDAGGKLYAGTDCANMCVPGLGLHQEMELLADSGIGPLKALQAATLHAAELLHKDRLGTLEEGKAGDVVVLDANPLEDIRNTRKIAKVISRGRLLDGQYHADFRNPLPNIVWEQSSHYFPSPRIRWASPEAMVAGATGMTLTVHGTGFIPYSIVRLGEEKLKTTFVASSQLTAEVPARLLVPGTYSVTVENPDFGWGSVFAGGASDIEHLGIRGPISNEFLVLVKPQGGAPVFPHPRETAQK